MPATKYDTPFRTSSKKLVRTELAEVQTAARRDQMDIIISILKESVEPIRKTHILFRVGLNYYQLSMYLRLLLKLGMVEKTSEPFVGYKIADKGRLLLQLVGTHFSQ